MCRYAISYELMPRVGIGPLKFNMHKEEVSHVFTHPYFSFFRNPGDKYRADHNLTLKILAHYDADCQVNEIHADPSRATAMLTLTYAGRDVTAISYEDAIALFGTVDSDYLEHENGIYFRELRLDLFNHRQQASRTDPVSCFCIHRDPAPFDV
jgi:hypothetical protein